MSVEPTPSNADSTTQFCALVSYIYGHTYLYYTIPLGAVKKAKASRESGTREQGVTIFTIFSVN